MKSGIHPDYHPVVFRDRAGDFAFLTRSTLTSERTVEWEDGNTYPVIDVEISSASHPFYTGSQRVVDTAGRVERFQRRYGGKDQQKKK
ncbi:type B 50S ribosomal protein L31 [Actinacidiphila acidipaludis]|uniref:Large ribosomal subunit protein bL31B n=1 Tax=Actinacidiphila acidipaludis TaxID=2873382 RepID=A0ABS7QE93_9ACTN|nr:type B 50S ribosomal protein L31 [Streptomyces acidipaludis]MBY8881498.1 type B 50S ribosomal protein L31 [Streptomyces acidipaludis]